MHQIRTILLFIIAIFYGNFFSLAQTQSKLDSVCSIINNSIEKGNVDKSLTLLEAYKNSEDYNSSQKLTLDFYLAKIYYEKGNSEKAVAMLVEGLDKLQKNPLDKLHCVYAHYLGKLFSKTNDLKKYKEYVLYDLEHALLRKDSLDISYAYNGLGAYYFSYARKFDYGKELDTAEIYFKKAVKLFPKLSKNKEKLMRSYKNLAYIEIEKNYLRKGKSSLEQLQLFKFYNKKAIQLASEANDTITIAEILIDEGVFEHDLGNLTTAKNKWLEALSIIGDIKNKSNDVLNSQLTLYGNLGYINDTLLNYKEAVLYLEKERKLSNKLKETEMKKELSEIEAKYNVEKSEKEIAIEKAKRQKAVTWNYGLGIASLLLLFGSWGAYKGYQLKRKNLTLAFKEKQLIQQQKIEKIKNETQIKILNATIDGKEKERKDIAQTLHDSVSTLLSSANLHLQASKGILKENTPIEIDKSKEIIVEASDKIRSLSHQLMSSVLLKFGLAYALDDLCEKYSNSVINFEAKTKNIERYNQDFEIKIYNITEEFINNILKHSKATKATIKAEQTNGNLELRIFDNGKGFDVKLLENNEKGGLGLHQINARIKMMGGVFDIKSSEKTGTRIYIHVPITF